MKRREFIALASGTAVGTSIFRPVVTQAQQPERMRRIGILAAGANDSDAQARIAAFRQGLQTLGWRESRNVIIDLIWGDYVDGGIGAAAQEIVTLKPDLILTNGDRGLRLLQQATRAIPIVFAGLNEPVDGGFVASLASPGGNITGFADVEPSLVGKQMGLIKQAIPSLSRAAVLQVLSATFSAEKKRILDTADRALGIKTSVISFSNATDIERGVAEFVREPNGAMVLQGESVIYRDLIFALLTHYRLPAISVFRSMAINGGLMSYGPDINDITRRAASYVDRILKGEKPGDLPVQLPTKFDLVINLKTAKALGLEIPLALLATADEVIE